MKTNFLIVSFIFSILISCSENHFRRFDILPENHRWEVLDIKTYKFDIEDENQFYNIVFLFSHVYGYLYTNIPLTVYIESPDGKTEELKINVPIKDNSGKDLGECAGDICDLKYTIKEKTKLQIGNYKITISHNFEGPFLPNVIGIGLNVENIK